MFLNRCNEEEGQHYGGREQSRALGKPTNNQQAVCRPFNLRLAQWSEETRPFYSARAVNCQQGM